MSPLGECGCFDTVIQPLGGQGGEEEEQDEKEEEEEEEAKVKAEAEKKEKGAEKERKRKRKQKRHQGGSRGGTGSPEGLRKGPKPPSNHRPHHPMGSALFWGVLGTRQGQHGEGPRGHSPSGGSAMGGVRQYMW